MEQSSINCNNISLASTSLPPICFGKSRMALTSLEHKSLSVLTNSFSNSSGCLIASSRTPRVLNPSLSWSSKTFFLLKTKCTRMDCTISVLFSACQTEKWHELYVDLNSYITLTDSFDVTDSNRKKWSWSSPPVMLNVNTYYTHVYYFLHAYAPRVFVMVVDCRDRICISRGKGREEGLGRGASQLLCKFENRLTWCMYVAPSIGQGPGDLARKRGGTAIYELYRYVLLWRVIGLQAVYSGIGYINQTHFPFKLINWLKILV